MSWSDKKILIWDSFIVSLPNMAKKITFQTLQTSFRQECYLLIGQGKDLIDED
jgi:hypothetical protein